VRQKSGRISIEAVCVADRLIILLTMTANSLVWSRLGLDRADLNRELGSKLLNLERDSTIKRFRLIGPGPNRTRPWEQI
jgi:hypothetical protein